MSVFYPSLPEGTTFALDVILQRLAEDPEFLQQSPYSPDEIAVLEKFTGIGSTMEDEAEEIDFEGLDKWDLLEKESRSLFKALTDAGKILDHKDNSEKMAYFRTATSLLEKIVAIQERTANLKAIHHFHTTVLTIMEDELSAAQRTNIIDRLKEAITPETPL